MSKFFQYNNTNSESEPDTLTDADLMRLIRAEMEGNIMILIDPKQKDSFSQSRVNTWTNTTSERVLYYVKKWMQKE
jgi:hypothetical protein